MTPVNILVRNPNTIRRSTQKQAVLPERFTVYDKAEGKTTEYTFWESLNKPGPITVPTEPNRPWDKDNSVDAHNLLSLKQFIASKQMPIAQLIEIDDPHQKAEEDADKAVRALSLQAKILELYQGKQLELMGNLLRRHRGSVEGLTAQEVFNQLRKLAEDKPAFLEEMFGESFRLTTFVVDRAVEKRLLEKRGEFYSHPATGMSWATLTELVHYLDSEKGTDMLLSIKSHLGTAAAPAPFQRLVESNSVALGSESGAAGSLGEGELQSREQLLSRAEIAVGKAIETKLFLLSGVGWYQDDLTNVKKRRGDLIEHYAANAVMLAELETLVAEPQK